MQRKYNVEYPLIKRGVYYAAELLVRQLANNAYGNLVPVYSIWISRFGVKKELQNTVTRFRMSAYEQDERKERCYSLSLWC